MMFRRLAFITAVVVALGAMAGCEVGSSAPVGENNQNNNNQNNNNQNNNNQNNNNNQQGDLADVVAGYWRVASITQVDENGQEVTLTNTEQNGVAVVGTAWFDKKSKASADLSVVTLIIQGGFAPEEEVPQAQLFHIYLEEQGSGDGTDSGDSSDSGDGTDTGDGTDQKGAFKQGGTIIAHVSDDSTTIGDYVVERSGDTLVFTLAEGQEAAVTKMVFEWADNRGYVFLDSGVMTGAKITGEDVDITCTDWAEISDNTFRKVDVSWSSDSFGVFTWTGNLLGSTDGSTPDDTLSVAMNFKGYVWLPGDGSAVFYVFDASAEEGIQAMTVTTTMEGEGPYSFTVDGCTYQGGDGSCTSVFPFTSFTLAESGCN